MNGECLKSYAFKFLTSQFATRIATSIALGLLLPHSLVSLATPPRVDWQHFSSKNADFAAAGVGVPVSLVIGDMDRDGTNDFVVAGAGPPSVVWYRWTRAGWQRRVLEPSALPATEGSLLFDVDNDADLELMIGCAKKGNAAWWWENPSPQFKGARAWTRRTIEDEANCKMCDPLFADYNGDHVKELLYWDESDYTLREVSSRHALKSSQAWDSQVLWTSPNRTPCRGLDLVDIDQDGLADLVGGGYWFRYDRESTKLVAHRIAGADRTGGYRSAVGDFVQGNRPEVALTRASGHGPLSIYQWIEMAWQANTLIQDIEQVRDLQVGDIDGDCNTDLFVSTGRQQVFFGNGRGEFVNEFINQTASFRQSCLGDLDGDGDVDIVSVALSSTGNVDVWLNRGTGKRGAIANSPVIDIWYGDKQHAGRIGTPQPWINVLGTVSAASGISELCYSFNEGPQRPLSMGPNLFRLSRLGDFNVDIRRSELREGPNLVRIMATDALGQKSHRDVTVHITSGKTWPLPFVLDWSKVENIQDVVEVLDGHWQLGPDGVLTLDPYYDRVLALGDLSWTDYEATTTIKFHHFTASPIPGAPYAQIPQFCMLMRWQGHHVDEQQPHAEWRPLGSIAMLRKSYGDPENVRWYMTGDRGINFKEDEGRKIELNTWYEVKMRVETLSGPRSRYSVKTWPKSQQEPTDWDLVSEEGVDDYQSGSMLLVAHHAAMTLGNVLIKPLSPER